MQPLDYALLNRMGDMHIIGYNTTIPALRVSAHCIVHLFVSFRVIVYSFAG
jgi:hypothetical protein